MLSYRKIKARMAFVYIGPTWWLVVQSLPLCCWWVGQSTWVILFVFFSPEFQITNLINSVVLG